MTLVEKGFAALDSAYKTQNCADDCTGSRILKIIHKLVH